MAPTSTPFPIDEQLLNALHDVNDPELPVDIVDLGLVYGVWREGRTTQVRITFTAMGCPCLDFLLQDVRERLMREPDIDDVQIEVVWDPPWTKARLTERGRDLLISWGVSV
ncbi:MAG: hypothetical protein KatS3mg057_3215 [Herpetosiphonaceae bacterium]|nr:MAG: hypothetical protein KatS3mg057_3215 [Herpetosiphonaceae bacterium]